MAAQSDRRIKIQEIYSKLDTLNDSGWHSEVVYSSKEFWKGKEIGFPIMAYVSPKIGRALWIVSGIHGEEPAGPCAIAENIDTIRKLGKDIPIVLLPLCNPHGYFKNYRYPHQKKWEEPGKNSSVGDSEFYLPELLRPVKPRSYESACPESKALTSRVLGLVKGYPPVVSVNLHEDSLLDKGYVYCSGQNRDLMGRVSKYVLNNLRKNHVKIQAFGETRFREPIVHGVVWDSVDGSIDELLSSKKIIVNNRVVSGPSSKASVVVEIPAKSLPLSARIGAHSAVIRSLKRISTLAGLF